jgi:uncharacterized protein YndB with AHSA1/START domain
MATVAVTQVVQVPVARVWTVFTDLPARAGWLSTVDGVEVLTQGTFGTGTTWRETRTMPGGARVTEEFRVEECNPPVRLTVSSPGAGVDYRITYTFSPVPLRGPIARRRSAAGQRHARRELRALSRSKGATAVTVVLEGSASGSAGRLLTLVLGGLGARVAEGALRQDLTDLAEATA